MHDSTKTPWLPLSLIAVGTATLAAGATLLMLHGQRSRTADPYDPTAAEEDAVPVAEAAFVADAADLEPDAIPDVSPDIPLSANTPASAADAPVAPLLRI